MLGSRHMDVQMLSKRIATMLDDCGLSEDAIAAYRARLPGARTTTMEESSVEKQPEGAMVDSSSSTSAMAASAAALGGRVAGGVGGAVVGGALHAGFSVASRAGSAVAGTAGTVATFTARRASGSLVASLGYPAAAVPAAAAAEWMTGMASDVTFGAVRSTSSCVWDMAQQATVSVASSAANSTLSFVGERAISGTFSVAKDALSWAGTAAESAQAVISDGYDQLGATDGGRGCLEATSLNGHDAPEEAEDAASSAARPVDGEGASDDVAEEGAPGLRSIWNLIRPWRQR